MNQRKTQRSGMKPGSAQAAAKPTADTLSSSSALTPAGGKDATTAFTPATLLTITEDHKEQLRHAFDLFDSTGTGRIPAQEVKVALYALGYDVNALELHHLLRDVGANTEDGVMDFNDFYNVIVRKMTQPESRQECVRAFKQIDEEDKGGIALQDLREIADSLRTNLTDDELTEMMQFAQPLGPTAGAGGGTSGQVDFEVRDSLMVSEEDFLRLMKQANVY